jgi:hypothetical protein
MIFRPSSSLSNVLTPIFLPVMLLAPSYDWPIILVVEILFFLKEDNKKSTIFRPTLLLISSKSNNRSSISKLRTNRMMIEYISLLDTSGVESVVTEINVASLILANTKTNHRIFQDFFLLIRSIITDFVYEHFCQ